MATAGSCMCGDVKYQFTGEPDAKALCHCTDCQKWSGGAFTSNVVVPSESFSVTSGSPSTYDVTGDSGKNNKHFFCGKCGSSLWTKLDVMPGKTVIKAGGLDNGAASLGDQIGVEFYCSSRVRYLNGIKDAQQVPKFGA